MGNPGTQVGEFMADKNDVLIAEYNENAAQARQHENQREAATRIVQGIAAAILGVSAFKEPGSGFRFFHQWTVLLAAMFLVLAGIFGLIASVYHYRKNRMHVERLSKAKRDLHQNVGLWDVSD